MIKFSKKYLMKIADYAHAYDPDYEKAITMQKKGEAFPEKNGQPYCDTSLGEKRGFGFNVATWMDGLLRQIHATEKFNMINTAATNAYAEVKIESTWSEKPIAKEAEKLKEYQSALQEHKKKGLSGLPEDVKRPNVTITNADRSTYSKEEMREQNDQRVEAYEASKRENLAKKLGLYVAAKRVFDGKPLWKKLLRPFTSISTLIQMKNLRDELDQDYAIGKEQLEGMTSFINNPHPEKYDHLTVMNSDGSVEYDETVKDTLGNDFRKVEHDEVSMSDYAADRNIIVNTDLDRPENEENHLFEEDIYRDFGTHNHKEILAKMENDPFAEHKEEKSPFIDPEKRGNGKEIDQANPEALNDSLF